MSRTRPELTWLDKESRPALEPHVLVEDTCESAGDNRLVFGDNLLALHALESEFGGRVKCVYIDPPYNTGGAYVHYDDDREHAAWLSFMRDRLEILRRFLTDDGVLFVSIDDSELAYLTVLLDEIFGRANFCGRLVWEKKKKPSFLNANLGTVTEYVLAYAKDRSRSPAFVNGVTTPGKKYPLNNAGNGVRILTFAQGAVRFRCPDQIFEPQDMSEGAIVTRLLDRLQVRGGKNVDAFRLEGEWRYSQATLDEIVGRGEPIVISKAPFRPNHVKEGGEPKKMKNLLTIPHFDMSTYEDAAEESRALFGDAAFDYPKPEKLIATLLGAVTEPGDWVLDCFAGSGTTGAVAHKMGRRWIMVEVGDHCRTHIVPRLTKVIDGQDAGGVTATFDWKGGGGFRTFRLVPSAPSPPIHRRRELG